MDNKMFIPENIKVGYQKRGDTYTGSLAYVIYFDDKGKLRKEKSWETWRDKKIKPQEFKNEPTSGFVLNKGVGGQRHSYGWNARNEYVRVYDPRNFEFEISVANLLFILQESSSIKGKGLEGEFVYSWSGTELILLPVECEEYKECTKHTARQAVKFKKEDIKEGHSYLMKDGLEVMYLGYHMYNAKHWRNGFAPAGKRHIFVPVEKRESYYDPYIVQTGYTKIAECTSQKALETFPKAYQKFLKSEYYGEYKEVKISKTDPTKDTGKSFLIKKDDIYYPARIQAISKYDYSYSSRSNQHITKYIVTVSGSAFKPEVKNGVPNLVKLPEAVKIKGYYSHWDTDWDKAAITEAELLKTEFYKANAITKQGVSIRI